MDKIGWITRTGVLLFVAACLSACRGGASSDRQSVWKCRLLEVEGGYGYVILHGHDTLIRQSCIPAIGERKPFATREDALKIGYIVRDKLDAGQSPTVSREEVRLALDGD